MKVFSVITGKTRIEFSVIFVDGKYQAKINDIVMFENHDYSLVSATLLDSLSTNVSYTGGLH